MTIANWTTNASGDWNTGSLWSGAVVPNASVDVTIDATTTLATYTVTIAAGETQTVHSLALNTANNFGGAHYPFSYTAAELELDGTLIFAAGSAGALAGSNQSYIHVAAHKNASLLNGGTLSGFFQVEGNLLLTGTNSVYIRNEIQALAGTVTIKAPIADIRGSTLIDGFFDAKGAGAIINLGGTTVGSANRIVNIATLTGPSFGWSELSLNGVTAAINEWNGSAYTPIEMSLTTIGDGATLDVLGGRNYTTSNALTIDATIGSSITNTMFNLQAGTVTVGGGININKGIVQGYGTIANNVVNNSTMIALGGSVGGTLDLIGNLTGTGVITFDLNASTRLVDPTAATLVLNNVSAGQTITLNTSNDIMVLATPASFAGTIAAVTGGQIVLQGLTATTAVLTNGTLVVKNGSQTVASLALAGSYTGDTITATGSVITIGAPISPSITGTVPVHAITDQGTIAPFAGVVIADRNFRALETITVTLSAPANGTLTNLGGGQYDPVRGIYTTSGSSAAVTADLEGLVFVPTLRQGAPGSSVVTRFTITDLDTFAQQVSDSATTVTTTVIGVKPTITGAAGGKVINGPGTITPFALVTIVDANIGQTETVTVTQFSPSFGTLTPLPGIGTYVAATGVYTVSGTASFVTAALNALIFTPTAAPGQDVTTTFSIADIDTALSQAVPDTTTSVTTIFPVAPPTITLTTANQAVTDQTTIRPFASALIADANIAQTETVTITLSSAANGTLAGGGSYVGGVYTITGDAIAVSSILAGLVFTPTAHQVAPGATVPTQFVINDIDSASQPATAVTVTVITTAVAVAPTIQPPSTGLAISDRGTIAPFPLVQIGDVNFGQTETVTVTLSDATNGMLINLGTGAYDPAAGVYTVSGDTVAVSAALNGLIFVPTQGEVAPGGTVPTIFTISDIDTAGATAPNATTSVIVTAGTVVPEISGPVPGQATTDQTAIAPFAHVAVTDANFGQTETVTVSFFSAANGTLTALPGVGSFAGGAYTASGSASYVTAALNGLVFTPTLHQVAPGGWITTDFTVHDTDTASQSAIAYSTSVTATAVAVLPIINGGRAGQAVTDQTTIRPFGAVVITDANLRQTETVTVSLSVPANGTLSNLSAGSYNSSTGIYTVIGAADAVTAALNGLVFTPTQHQVAPGSSAPTSFTITDTDTAGATTSNTTTSVVATAGMVMPTINGGLAGQPTSDQATIKPFSAVVIADANFGQTETVTVSLAPTHGTLSNPNAGNYNPATGVYTVIGNIGTVTAALNGLVFTPTQHQVAPGATIATSFTITTTDTAGATVNNTTASVIATAGTVAPTINGGLAGQPTSDQATIKPFANVVIADANFGQTETVTVSLSPTNGTLTNPNAGNYNPATGVYTVSGSIGAVTTALNELVFTPTLHQVAPGGTVTTAFTITDTDTAGATVNNTTASVIATAGTVAPTISGGPTGQPTSDQATIRPFGAVVIADANFGQTETVTVSLSPANGTLSNPNAGSYNPATGVYTVSGTADAVTAALNGLIFIPTPHQIAPGGTVATTFTIRDTDTAGRTVIDTATSVITTAVATPPTINGAQAGQGATDQTTIMPFRAIVIADANVGQTQTVTVTLSTASNGTLSNPGAGSYNPSTGVYTLTGTVGAVNAALNGLVFTPTLHQIAPGGNVATGLTILDTDTAGAKALNTGTSVIVASVAVPPTINGARWDQTTTDNGTITPFAGIVIDDANFGQTETVTVALSSAANGTLSNLSGGNYNAAAGVYSYVGSAAAATAALRGLVFTPTPHQVAAGGLVATSFTIRDTDSAAATATNTTTSVIVTAAPSMAFIVKDNITGASIDSAGVPYTGPQPGLELQYVAPTQNGVSINTSRPNAYIVTGSGDDAIDTSAGGGNNVINAYGGSNFITGGSGDNTIFLDNRNLTTDIWTTITDYHAGDAVTLYGLTPSQKYSWWNGLGATGYQGLTMLMQQPGQPNVALTLTGHMDADLTNGKLSLVYGDQETANPYLYVHGE